MHESDDGDAFWMRRALAEAFLGRGAVEPNPMVGAALVRDGHLVGVGHHARFGGPHAEVMALREAGEAARGATLYVTLEPCCHQGKTPPCADALIRAGVSRVVAAMRDPFPRVDGGGFARLREAGIDVLAGVAEAEARRLNAPYLKVLSTERPFVIAKWAMTLDGKIATGSGDSRWISNERSRAVVHEIRGRVDAVLVGIGTALADDPELTARPPGPRVAARVVLDSTARLPTTSRLVATAERAPLIVMAGSDAPQERIEALGLAAGEGFAGMRWPRARPTVHDACDALFGLGHTNVLVEGGPTVLGAFLDAGEVDAVEVFVAPIVEGGSAGGAVRGVGVARMAEALRLVEVEHASLDGDMHIRGLVDRPWLHPRSA